MSNLRGKKFALKVRHHFQCPASFHATGHFSEEKREHRFSSFTSKVLLQKRFHPYDFWLDRTLKAKFDHCGSFRRTFRSFTSLPYQAVRLIFPWREPGRGREQDARSFVLALSGEEV